MIELTLKKIMPLLTSSIWYKRLVGEYYEIVIRREAARNRIEKLYYRMGTTPDAHVTAVQTEIEMLQEQVEIMSRYEDVLFRRIVQHGIPYVDIMNDAVQLMADNGDDEDGNQRDMGLHGRWIKLPDSCQADYECSECGAGIGKIKPPYCAICGAEMDASD